jgi:hypothetical protein
LFDIKNIRSEFEKIIKDQSSAFVDTAKYNDITRIDKDHRWDDAVSVQYPEKFNELVKKPRAHHRLYETVAAHLGHLIINPTKRPASTQALVDAYVYDSNRIESLNSSPATVDSFIDEAIADAKENRDNSSATNLQSTPPPRYRMKKTIRLLVGRRGVGKTFFLNHLLAKYSSKFDQQRVIWVRLNLVDDFGDNSNLQHWIYAQTTKLVLRYYCQDSNLAKALPPENLLDCVQALRTYVDETAQLGETVRLSRAEIVENLLNVFVKNTSDESVTPSLIPEPVSRHIWTHAVSQGYSFIVAIDGLDRLESSLSSGSKFDSLVRGLGAILSAAENSACLLIVACRQKTAQQLSGRQTGPFNSSRPTLYRITVPNFEEILGARLKFIEKYLRREEVCRATGVDGSLAVALLGDFQRSLESDIAQFKMFGQNLRAAVQALQLRHEEFTTFGPDHHHYRWVESVMRSGWRFPPKLSQYTPGRSNENPFDFNSTSELTFDNRLLPSIFAYPYLPWGSKPKAKPDFEYSMLGVRILQLVNAADSLQREQTAESSVTINIVMDLISTLFPKYSGNITLALMRDLIEFDVIDADNVSTSPSNLPGIDSLVHLTPKGRFILEHCLTDVAYLGMSAMRLPMDARMLSRSSEDVPAIFVAKPHLSESKADSGGRILVEWVQAKAINSINFVKLLDFVDERQISTIRNRHMLIENKLSTKNHEKHHDTWRIRIYKAFLDLQPRVFAEARSALNKQIIGMIDSVITEERSESIDRFRTALLMNARIWS